MHIIKMYYLVECKNERCKILRSCENPVEKIIVAMHELSNQSIEFVADVYAVRECGLYCVPTNQNEYVIYNVQFEPGYVYGMSMCVEKSHIWEWTYFKSETLLLNKVNDEFKKKLA